MLIPCPEFHITYTHVNTLPQKLANIVNLMKLFTENEPKQLWKGQCYSLTIWNGNLVCGGDKVISIWNSNRECIMKLKGHTRGIWSLVVWNEFLVSGSTDDTIRIW